MALKRHGYTLNYHKGIRLFLLVRTEYKKNKRSAIYEITKRSACSSRSIYYFNRTASFNNTNCSIQDILSAKTHTKGRKRMSAVILKTIIQSVHMQRRREFIETVLITFTEISTRTLVDSLITVCDCCLGMLIASRFSICEHSITTHPEMQIMYIFRGSQSMLKVKIKLVSLIH